MTQEPFEKLKSLEERFKKAEQYIPELESQLKAAQENAAKNASALAKVSVILGKYQEFQEALRALTGDPPVSTGTTATPGTVEVTDPAKIIEVQDPQEPLRVSTTELRGQIAKLILEGRISTTLVNAKAVRAALISEFGSSGEAWDIDSVLKELKALAAPPFRLFSFSPKNYMFRLRTGSEKRVKE